MRLRALTLSKVGPFRGTSRLDLSAIPGRIVAFTGANGAGKSSALEMAGPGALYRDLPTRGLGALAKLALAKDSYVSATYDTPRGVRTFTQSTDGDRNEAQVTDESGAPVLPTTSVKAYDAWALDNLPPLDVYLASLFSPQSAGSFFDLAPAESKAVVLGCLRISRFEKMAARAREKAAAQRGVVAGIAAEAQAERSRADVAGPDAARRGCVEALSNAASECQLATSNLAHAQASHAALVAAYADAKATADGAQRARAREAVAREAMRKLADEAERHRAAERAHAGVEEAVASLPRLDADVAASERGDERIREQVRGLEADEKVYRRDVIDAKARVFRHEGEEKRAREAAAGIEPARAAQASLPDLQRAVRESTALVKACEEKLEALRGAGLNVAEKRIGKLRHAMEYVQAGAHVVVSDPAGFATGVIREDDAIVRAAAAAPQARADAAGALIAAREADQKADAAIVAAVRLADRLPYLERQSQTAGTAAADAATARADLATAEGKVAAVVAQLATDRTIAARIAGELNAARVLRAGAREIAAGAPALAAARAALAQIALREADARAELDAARREVELHPEPPALPPLPPDLSKLEEAVAAAEKAHDAARGALSRAEAALDAARAAAAKADALDLDRAAAEEHLADLVKVADDLGAKGLIAMEVDAAGPEITAAANGLLRAGFGSRFTVEIETTREKADGEGHVEVFEVIVTDTFKGWRGSARLLSGGERVVVGEALRFALLVVAARGLGLGEITVFLDEAGAALSPSEAIPGCDSSEPATHQHLRMIRKAAELSNAQVLLVSHDPGVLPLCDARVRIDGEGAFHVDQ